jgi:hypothetical protein
MSFAAAGYRLGDGLQCLNDLSVFDRFICLIQQSCFLRARIGYDIPARSCFRQLVWFMLLRNTRVFHRNLAAGDRN